uniref:Uncharacterized protein n=1 Tax=Tanacetum cinerariifolium TaxID=118510 RepID=A0A699J252_TANCI|nr:hypothetical protein [Tanacetum cinerariifolium]
MPNERKNRPVSTDKLRDSPYQCSTGHSKQSLNKYPLESCRPYMCDTRYRDSNCFDQFKKSLSDVQMSGSLTSKSRPSFSLIEEIQPSAIISESLTPIVITETSLTTENVVKAKSKLLCPLCSREVNGTVVVDAARSFMNTKLRSCASETCDFSGTYADLRKHARNVHLFARPLEVDPERQRDWRRMERQRDFRDLLSESSSHYTFSLFNGNVEEFLEIDKKEENFLKECY